MTRKDFELIAGVLRERYADAFSVVNEDGVEFGRYSTHFEADTIAEKLGVMYSPRKYWVKRVTEV